MLSVWSVVLVVRSDPVANFPEERNAREFLALEADYVSRDLNSVL